MGEHEDPPADVYRDHVGIHAQKQAGYFYVGGSVLRGRITPSQMRAAAELAESLANGELAALHTATTITVYDHELSVGRRCIRNVRYAVIRFSVVGFPPLTIVIFIITVGIIPAPAGRVGVLKIFNREWRRAIITGFQHC